MNLTTILRTAKAALTSSSISNLATATSSSRKPRFFTSALLVLSFVFSLLRVESGWGQTPLSTNYVFSTNTTSSLALDLNGNAVDMTTGTTSILATQTSQDNSINSAAIPFGFDYFFGGNRYNAFYATSNGIVQLCLTGATATISGSTYTASSGVAAAPRFSAFDGDLGTGTTGGVFGKLIGSGNNRCYVIEFRNMNLMWNTYTNDGTWQIRFYESNGIVEYVYGSMYVNTISSATDATPEIGFSWNTTTSTYLSLGNIASGTLSSASVNTTTSTLVQNTVTAATNVLNLHSTANGARRSISFIPTATTAPSGLSFTNVGISTTTLNWIDNSTAEVGYVVYRSTDNVNFSYVATTAANTSTYAATGLNGGTTYYWKVFVLRESIGSALNGSQATAPCPTYSGTLSVGPAAATFPNLTTAISTLSSCGYTGNIILELQSGYTSSGETFPLTFGTGLGSNSSKTITIRPTSGATGLSITSANATATIDLNGAAYVTFDGRPGGAGTKDLTIENTSTSGVAVRYINDALNNTLKYVIVKGVNSSTSSGVILFSTTTGTNGNDNNTIDYCDIRDGATTPTNGIYSSGTTTSTATNNSNNTIGNSSIFNFFLASGGATSGISLQAGNTDWTISNNSFYQTATRTTTAGSAYIYGITIANSTSGNNFIITGNYIGGTTVSAGGSPWTIAGAFSNRFNAIGLSVGTTTASSIQGNTIKNMVFTTTSAATANSTSSPLATGMWGGIMIAAGNVNVGTVTANVIGSSTGTGSISVTGQTTGGTVNGIGISGSGTVSVSNNIVGSITANGSVVTISTGIIGIQTVSTGSVTISNNVIGSTITANSLNAATAATGTTGQLIYGIYNSGNATAISITNNTISNLTNAYAPTPSYGTGPVLVGVYSNNGVNSITGNTIKELTTAALATSFSGSVIGIFISSTVAPTNVNQNTIYNLSNTNNTTTSGLYTNGITYTSATTGSNNVNGNLIYNLSNASYFTTNSCTWGIYITGGSTTFSNNIIRIGAGVNNDVRGFAEYGGVNNYYFNSVYLDGGATTGSLNSFACYSNISTNPTTRNFKNNIFVNGRSNAGGTGKNYSIFHNTTSGGLSSNNNVFYAPGTGGVLGYYNGSDRLTLSAFQTASSNDGGSFNSNPNFIDPTGGTPNLHINSSLGTVVEGTGVNIATITSDFDGETRSGLTPVDIGADAGIFVAAAPQISVTSVTPAATSQCSSSNRVIAVSVTTSAGTISSVVLNYSHNGVAQTAINMSNTSGSTYTGTMIAPSISTATVTWSITATSSAGFTTSYTGTSFSDNPNVGITATATANPTTVCAGSNSNLSSSVSKSLFTELFEASPTSQFTVVNTSGTYTATQNSTYFSQGTSCAIFSTASLSANGQLAMTNSLSLVGMSAAQLTFSHIASMEGPSTSYDYGYVEYSTDGGSTWTTFPTSSYSGTATLLNSLVCFSTKSYPDWISTFSSATATPTNSLWKNEVINIPVALLSSSNFKIRFRYTTDSSTDYLGWYIDNVNLVGTPTITAFSWSPTTALTSTTISNPVANPTSTTAYTCTATVNGCPVVSNAATITVNALPIVSASTASSSICLGTSTTLSGSGASTYSWTPATNLSATTGSPTYTPLAAGNATYTVTGTNANGCSSTASVIVNAIAPPAAVTVSGVSPDCNNTLLTASGGSGGNIYYQGSTSNGNSTLTLSSSQSVSSSGTYYFRSYDGTCFGPQGSLSVVINTQPVITVQPSTVSEAKCNLSQTFSPLSITATGTNLTYQWYSNTTSSTSGGTSITGATSATYTPSNAMVGTTYYYCVVSSASCPSTTSAVSGARIVITSPVAPVVLPLTQTVNVGASATFTSTRSTASNTLTWWTAASGGTEIDPDGPTLSVDSVFNSYDAVILPTTSIDFCTPNLTNSSSTIYKYYVQQYDGTCPSPRTEVMVFTNPLVTSSSSNNLICQSNATVTLTANVTQETGSVIQWLSNTNSTGSFTNVSNSNPVTVQPAISTMYQLNTASLMPFGCTGSFNSTLVSLASTQQSVLVYPSLDFTPASNPSSVCIGGTSTLTPNTPTGNFTASCITPVSSLSTPPSGVTVNTLVTNGAIQTLPSGVTVYSSSLDDNYWGNVPIGFTYNFFGQNANTVYIGSNGTIVVGISGAVGSTQYNFTGGFPNSANPANTVAVSARDLHMAHGTVRYWTEGFAPTRRFIVQYDSLRTYTNSCDVSPYSNYGYGYQKAEAVFYETSGIIDIRVIKATNGTSWSSLCSTGASNSVKKYIGLQDPSKSIGATAPNCSSPYQANYWNGITNEITSPLAWRFAPPANYNIKWFLGTGNSASLVANLPYVSGAASSTYNYSTLSSQSQNPGQVSYTVSATNTNTNCPSSQTLAITVNALPVAPNSGGNVTACSNATTTTLSAIAPSGCTIDWYSNINGTGTPLASGTSNYSFAPSSVAGVYTYYAFSKNTSTGCMSANGTAILLTVYQAPAPPVSATTAFTYCEGANATQLTATPLNGNTLNWYSGTLSSTPSSTAPTPSTATNSGSPFTFYATQVSGTNGCQSNATTFTVTVNNTPAAPVLAATSATSGFSINPQGTISYCQGATTYPLWATGLSSNLLNNPGSSQQYWYYTSPTGSGGQTSTSPIPSSATAGAMTYYVSRQNTTTLCEGARTPLIVVINPSLTPVVAISATSTSVCSGGAITFTATPTNGGPTPTYQWYLNGSVVSGQTTPTYTLANPNVGDAIYVTMVSNEPSCLFTPNATSATVTLSNGAASPSVSIIQSTGSTICAGTAVTFSVLSSANMGGTPTYSWKVNGVNVGLGSSYTTTSLVNSDLVTLNMTSSLSSSCINGNGTAISNGISMTVTPATAISAQPVNAAVCLGGAQSLSVTAVGTGTITYQWKSAATSAGPFTNIPFASNSSSQSSTLSIPSVSGQLSYQLVASSSCGTATSSVATISINQATAITAQPQAIVACQGTSATFTVTAIGTGVVSYQWRYNGVPISGATSSTYTIPSLSLSSPGQYSVVVSASCGSVTSSNAQLTVNPLTTISNQPTGVSICDSNAFSLSVTASGTAPITYQWYRGATAISGATSALYSDLNGVVSESGNYTVVVTGGCSNVTSSVATVLINPNTWITAQPQTYAGCALNPTSLSVTGLGANLQYQWNLGSNPSNPITGATNSTLSFSNPQTSNSGSYSVTLTGVCGTQTSNIALVTINPVPSAGTIIGGNSGVCVGSSINLINLASGGVWSTSNSALANISSTGVLTGVSAGSITVTYTVTNSFGCVSVATKIIQVKGLPSAVIQTPLATSICQGESMNLLASAAVSYMWSNGATTQSTSVNSSATGTSNYSVSVTGTNGCTASSAPLAITVIPVPTIASISGSGNFPNLCLGNATNLSNATPNGLWSSNNTTVMTVNPNTGSANALAIGTATISYHVANIPGCLNPNPGTATVSITVSTPPSAYITPSGSTTFCSGGSVILSAPIGAGYNYLWSNGSTSQSITVSTSGTLTVTVTAAGGCSVTSLPTTVNVLPIPTATIYPTGAINICSGTNVTLSTGSAVSYLWSNGVNTPTISVNTAGTYSVTLTGTNGCTATSAVSTVTVTPVPSAVITANGPTNICDGGSVGLSVPTAQSYLWSNGATTQAITATSTGNYSVTATNGICSATSTPTFVNFNPVPSSVITASGPTTFCQGGNVSLSAPNGNSYTYLWTNGATSQSITVSNTGVYGVTVSNSFGCSSTSIPVSVIVNSLPVASITAAGSTTICSGSFVNLSAPAGGTYLWSNGATTQFINAASAGNYTVTVSTLAGCSATSTPTTISVNALPSAAISSNGSTTFCQGGNVGLTANNGMSAYLWSNGNTGQSISATSSGSYSVQVTDANGCSANSNVISVVVNQAPIATIYPGTNVTICSGSSVTLSTNSASSYTWSNGSHSPTVQVNTSGLYSVTLTGSNGCSATSSVTTVAVTTTPTAAITASGPTTICQGSNVNLSAPAAANTYLWNTGATTQSINVSLVGSYYVTVGSNGCSATSPSTFVSYNPVPSAAVTASGPTTFCQGNSVTFSAPAGNGNTYVWNTGATTQSVSTSTAGNFSVTVTNGYGCSATSTTSSVLINPLPVVTPITGSSSICAGTQGQVSNVMTGGVYASSNLGVASIGQLSGQITGLTAGTTTISYVYTNANGCSNTVTYPVSIIAAPVATITAGGPTTFCQGGSVLLTASSGTSYVWNTGETTATITATTAGNYSVTVTGANGCSATSLATTVNILTPSPVSAINGASAVCVNSATALTNASSGGVWTSSTPAVATISAAGIVTGVSAGTTTISYTINSTNGCQNTTTKVVTVNAVPSTALTASGATTFCQGGNVQLTASAGATYAWNNGATTSSITATTAGTYNVTVTNANGCSSVSTNQTITVNALPIAQISTNGSTNLCTGGSITLMATPSASYLWSTGATTSSITTSTAGTYTVAVTNANGCSATSTATNVAVNASPSATVTASGPTTICSGNNVVLTATSVVGNTYQWMKNGVLIPGATLNVYTATTSGSYSLLVTNASGCSSTSAITAITVNAAPVANITAGGATTFCSGGSVTLTASAGTSYLWSTGATTASIIATTAGSRTVTVTNAAGCSTTSAPINIVVNTMPTATITAGGPTSICSGSNVTLTASGGSTYVWNNGATTASIVANTSGNYSVTVYNANGCSAISTPTTVTVNNPSVANVSTSGPTTFCQGGSVNLTATTAASYAWSNGATTQSISVNTSGNYSVVLTNASGCTSTSPVIAVTANALPTATITAGGSTTFCQGGSVTLTASPATSYLWSNGATGSSINVTTAGNYTVQIANNSGCTANSAATTVTVNALPVATITAGGSLSICAGSSVNLTASTGTAYLWSNGATTATIAASNAGNYTVQVSNAAGCTSTSSVSSVIVNALPTPSITSVGSTTICQGASVTLTTANGSGLTYQWKNNGTNISGATAASYVASTAGNYTVQMTNAAGCSGTSTATTVTVNALPVASISNSGSNTICSGSSVNLTASTGTTYAWSNGATTATIAVNATGNYSVIVTNAAGCTNSAATTITVVTPTVASISANGPTYFCTGQNVVLTANTGASYLWSTGATTASITVAATSNISVQVTYASGCVSTSPITAVNVNALPVASITASGATSFCPGSSVTLTASNGSSYVWTNGATTNSIVVSSAGSYGVTVANAAGCSSVAAPTSIVVFAAPTATITPSAATTFCQGASINLTANAAAGYAWSNGASTSSISVNNSGNFTVTVTDANGCSAISSVVPVTVNAVPVASIQANGPTTVCQGTSVVLTANGGTGFAWSNSETTASITVNATGSYGVTVTNAAGCSSVVTPVSITVNPVQILSPIVGATNVCVGSSTTYTNSTSGGTWSSDNTAVAAVNATNGIVSGISTGSATIKYQFVNASGCTSEVTKVVTVNGIQPVSIAASGSTTFCQGGTVTLTAPAGLNYNWTNGATTQSITVNASGIYGITASNVAGCSTTSSTVAVTVNPAPVASISSTSTALCQGSNLVLNAPANAATYAWSNGATTQNVLITAPGVYSLTLTDANGCSASASTTIVNGINPVATIAAGGATTFCSGGSVVLNAAGGTSFLWNNGATTQNITVNTPGNYSVMVTNAAGCSAMSNATMVNVLQSPNAVATAYGPTTFCQGGSVTIATSGGATYAWSNGSTAQSILPTTSGTYSVVVTAVNGCTATSNPINVTVNPTPTAVITPSGTTTFCEGSSVNLVASGGSNYAWSNGPNTSSITITTGGTYTVTVTNAGGCTDTETISVTVNEVPSAFIVTSGATTFCQGGQVNLTAQAGNSYLWSNNATTQSISVASAGTYSVTIQSPNGCSVSSNAISVTVNQPSASSLNATAFDSYTLNGILYTQSGTYTQNLTNAAGCDSTITLNLTLTVGIEEGTLTDVNVYPNPTSESFTIKTTVPVYGVYSVVDAQGKLIFEGELTGTETQINISSVARGIYYLRIPELSEPLRVVKN